MRIYSRQPCDVHVGEEEEMMPSGWHEEYKLIRRKGEEESNTKA